MFNLLYHKKRNQNKIKWLVFNFRYVLLDRAEDVLEHTHPLLFLGLNWQITKQRQYRRCLKCTRWSCLSTVIDLPAGCKYCTKSKSVLFRSVCIAAAWSYLLVVSDLFVDLRLDHSFGDGPANTRQRAWSAGQGTPVFFQTAMSEVFPRILLLTWPWWGSSGWGLSWRRAHRQEKRRGCEQLSGNSGLWRVGGE